MPSLAKAAGIGLLMASAGLAQETPPGAQSASSAAPTLDQASPSTDTATWITVPAGTRIPVTLNTPVHSKSAHHGDIVRLQTAFPVTVGTELAIPAGTYVEAAIDTVVKRSYGEPNGTLRMNFKRLVFSSGYKVKLEATTLQAGAKAATSPMAENSAVAVASERPEGATSGLPYAMSLQQPSAPTLPQVSAPGPSKGTLIGAGVAAIAVGTVVGILIARHRSVDTFFEPGTQFDMVLQNSLPLDARLVAAGSTTP
jgi:hypothetical protein